MGLSPYTRRVKRVCDARGIPDVCRSLAHVWDFSQGKRTWHILFSDSAGRDDDFLHGCPRQRRRGEGWAVQRSNLRSKCHDPPKWWTNSGNPGEDKTGATAWFDYSTEIYTIEPGKGLERTFTVTVPKDTKPGQYIAALSFETADPLTIPDAPNLKQTLRQTIAFAITVPGTVTPAFEIKDVHVIADPNWTGIEATISNTGNVLVEPSGTISISDLKGTPLGSFEVTLGKYYAFKDGLIQLGLGNLTPNGEYLVTIDLHDQATGANAVIENQKIQVTTSAQIAAAEAPPVVFSEAVGELKPSADKPQFLNVTATLSN